MPTRSDNIIANRTNEQEIPKDSSRFTTRFADWLFEIVSTRLGFLRKSRIAVRAQPEKNVDSIIFDFSNSQVVIPLRSDFAFRHEPANADLDGQFIGRGKEVNELAARLLYSCGGTFLLTGFRGVGKTSFINQVLKKVNLNLNALEPQSDAHLVDIRMNLPRRMQPVELMHQILRCLYIRLGEKRILGRLDASLENDLLAAYRRTSASVAQQRSQGFEFGFGNEMSVDSPLGKAGLKLPFQAKRSRGEVTTSTFGIHDERSAEHDLIRLAKRIAIGPGRKPSFFAKFMLGQKPLKLKVVFVFDELDKLEGGDQVDAGNVGSSTGLPLDAIMGSLKTLLTTSGMSFVFVAGKDLYDRWTEEVGSGDSIYESIFAYDKYLPCLWLEAKPLANTFIDLKSLKLQPCEVCRSSFESKLFFCKNCGKYLQDGKVAWNVYDDFMLYLEYRGRGIPRRMWRAFNQSVKWYEGAPVVAFSQQDMRQHKVYAEVCTILKSNDEKLFGDTSDDLQSDAGDSPRLGAHYIMDWILGRGPNPFTEADLIKWSKSISAKILPPSFVVERLIGDLLEILTKAGVIQELKAGREVQHRIVVEGENVRLQEANLVGPKRYKLDARRRRDLGKGKVELIEDLNLFRGDSGLQFGEYTILDNLGSGGMGRVYRAVQKGRSVAVALKVIKSGVNWDQGLNVRFEREVALLASLSHPNLVRCLDSGVDGENHFLAMDLIDGVELKSVLEAKGRLSIDEFLAIALPIADVLNYLHSNGIIRNDLKPENIMISVEGKVVMIDLGTSKKLNAERRLTTLGAIIGTPSYMAPEQIRGQGIDHRCDIYSFGAMMYAMLTGYAVIDVLGVEAQLNAVLHGEVVAPQVHNPAIPDAIEALILRCLAKSPDQRPASAQEIKSFIATFKSSPIHLGALVIHARAQQKETEVKSREPTRRAPSISPSSVIGTAEFTRMFQSVSLRKAAVPAIAPPQPHTAPPPPRAEQTSYFRKGQFTMMFGSRPPDTKARTPAVFLDVHRAVAFLQPVPGKKTIEAVQNISNGRFRIGRDPDNELKIDDPLVSRFHAEILEDNDGHWIEDLGSSGGTKVNGKLVTGQMPLEKSGLISIGGVEMRFS